MKRTMWVTTFFFLLALIVGACNPVKIPITPTAAATIAVQDGLNRQVTLKEQARRIVSLSASNTEILYAIGAGVQMVGRDEFSDFPAEAKSLASVGGSMGKYNLEEIARLQPDLVLAAEINTPEQVKALENLNLNVFYLANPKDFNGLYTNLKIIGKLTGRDVEAQKLIDSLEQRVKAVQEKTAKATTKPKVFYELDATEPAKPYTIGPGTFIDMLIQMAGGNNIGAALKGEWVQISVEQLLVANPEIILLGDSNYGITPKQVAERPGWSIMKAVKENKVLAFDDNLVARPGPRLVDGLESIARLVHPELYP